MQLNALHIHAHVPALLEVVGTFPVQVDLLMTIYFGIINVCNIAFGGFLLVLKNIVHP